MGSGGSKSVAKNVTQNNNQNESSTEGMENKNDKEPAGGNSTSVSNRVSSESKQPSNKKVSSSSPATAKNGSPNTSKTPKEVSSSTSKIEKEVASVSREEEELVLPEVQQSFDTAVRFSCGLVKSDSVIKHVNKGVEKLELHRSFPHHINIFSVASKLSDLQVLDVSGNQMGAASFRLLLLSLCHNTSITTLNVADNHTDTDSAECVGQLIRSNESLTCLNVSGNYLGKDYFSRCVGPALAHNSTLKMLKCESIGATDLKVLGDNLKNNKTLMSLNINSNELSAAKTFIQGLGAWLMDSDCPLETMEMRNTGIKEGCLQILTDVIQKNTSLQSLNLAANKAPNTSDVLNIVKVCACHPKMKQLRLDDIKVNQIDSWSPPGDPWSGCSVLEQLSMSGCSLKNEHFHSLLKYLGQGGMAALSDLNVASNSDLSTVALAHVKSLTTPVSVAPEEDTESKPEPGSSLCCLRLGHNNMEEIAEFLMTGAFPKLTYLNLLRSKISGSGIGKLGGCIKKGGVSTLVLDGHKLAGSDAFPALFGENPQLLALSLGGCQLNDADITPLCQALKAGMPLHMLKLSGNRFTDQAIKNFCEALVAQKTHPLALVDFSSNSIEQEGAQKLAELLTHKKHKSQLHSLNMSDNNIKGLGAVKLISCIGRSSLLSLNLNNQHCGYEEQDMDDISIQLTTSLGIKLVQNKDSITPAVCEMPRLPAGLTIRLQGLGGEAGELGKLLDSSSVMTDYSRQVSTQLTFQDVSHLVAGLTRSETDKCVLSSEDWQKIVSLEKEAPSWLKLAEHRERALYMTRLPASVTVQKMEGLLEMEADCNVDEICLMKDSVTRQNNGFAWALLSDVESVQRAVDFYARGEARVFSQPFTISRLPVLVDDAVSGLAAEKAKEDVSRRLQDKKTEQAAHRALIQRSYIESQERHAYRLANPAYADGRIW